MEKKKIIILGALLVVIGALMWFTKDAEEGSLGSQDVKYVEPADAVDGFYSAWLKAAQDASALPDHATLTKSSALSKDFRAKLAAALKAGATPDPVLCQNPAPQAITLRTVYAQADKAEMLVTAKDKTITKQAVVSLTKSKDSWSISDIKCTDGDVAPVREFNFDQEGFLIKTSVPKPFNSQNWHLVFTQDGKAGNVVPLIFDAKSQCTNLAGVKAVCNLTQLKETDKVLIRGGMTERGATVTQLIYVK